MNFQTNEKLLNMAKNHLDDAIKTMKKINLLSNSLKNYPPEYEYTANVNNLLEEIPNIFSKINDVTKKLYGLDLSFNNSFSTLNFNIVDNNKLNTGEVITNYFYELHAKRNNLTNEEQEIYNAIRNTLKTNLINNVNIKYSYKKYDLTDDEVKQIASLCMQEQGSLEGAKAEASLMANLYEEKKRDGKATDLYSYVRDSGWFANSKKIMDKKNAPEEINEAVKSVLVDGNRTLPPYVNEHDCLSDISYISNNNVMLDKNDKNNYIKNVSVIQQSTSSFGANAGEWTYYIYPDDNSDPFGYTDKSVNEVLDEMIENRDIKY